MKWGIQTSTDLAAVLGLLLVFAVPMAAQAVVNAVVNYAEELTDFGVPPQDGLQSEIASPTPTSVPGGKVVTTEELAAALASGGDRLLLIDTWNDTTHSTLPGAQRMPFAGEPGDFQDDVQEWLRDFLFQMTDEQADLPLVFFCAGTRCWESYNAARRAIELGFSNVYWYRGGVGAWQQAGLPLVTASSGCTAEQALALVDRGFSTDEVRRLCALAPAGQQ